MRRPTPAVVVGSLISQHLQGDPLTEERRPACSIVQPICSSGDETMMVRILCAVTALALVGCDSPTQTGDAPKSQEPSATKTVERPASTPTTKTAESPSTGTTTAPKGTTTGAAPPVSGAGGPSPGATPPSIASLQGAPFKAGPVSIALRPDNSFEMQSAATKETVTGRYTYNDGVISFTDPKGDIGGAKFPMQCRIVATDGGGFQLTDAGGSCSYFQDLKFTR